jgi:hypothetical protein
MSKLRWGVAGLALLSVGVLVTPASAASRSVFKARGKELTAVMTTCPAHAPVGTHCVTWLVFASQFRLQQNGAVQGVGTLNADEFEITITPSGFDATHVAVGTGTPTTLRIADDLSTGSVTGTLDVQCDPQASGCVASTAAISLQLTANAPASFFRNKSVSELDGCRTLERSNFRERTADGSAVIGGASHTSSSDGPFPSTIGRSGSTTILRGTCPTGP